MTNHLKQRITTASQSCHNVTFYRLHHCHLSSQLLTNHLKQRITTASQCCHNVTFYRLRHCYLSSQLLTNHLKPRITSASQCCRNVTFYRVSITASCPSSSSQNHLKQRTKLQLHSAVISRFLLCLSHCQSSSHLLAYHLKPRITTASQCCHNVTNSTVCHCQLSSKP